MNRASPADLRKALDVVDAYIKAGILFVPMPVLGEADHRMLVDKADSRLDQIAKRQEVAQGDVTIYAVEVAHA